MKITFANAAIALAFAASAGSVEAQLAGTQAMVSSDAEAAHAAYDPAQTRAQLDQAHTLAMSGNFTEARRAYRAIADTQKAAGVLAGEALWKVAALEFGRGGRHQLRAAAVMVELAEQAEIYGDPALQARALVEAAILYQQHGRTAHARTCVARLEPLLQSPHLSSELQDEITSRLRRS